MSVASQMIEAELKVVERNLEIARNLKSASARKASVTHCRLKRDYLLARQENEALYAENQRLKREIRDLKVKHDG